MAERKGRRQCTICDRKLPRGWPHYYCPLCAVVLGRNRRPDGSTRPGREQRIGRYEQRAALRLPLFDAEGR